jgi:hypothetical protein
MLRAAALAHPAYLQPELHQFVQRYIGPWRWSNWMEDRQRFQAFGGHPATCREDRLWRFIPRLTATHVRTGEASRSGL